MNEDLDKIDSIKTRCGECNGNRNCYIRGSYKETGGDDNVSFWKYWYILQCKGCDHVFLYTVYRDSISYDYYRDLNGEEQAYFYETVEYFPSTSGRKIPESFLEIKITDVVKRKVFLDTIKELYGACSGGLKMLAAVGLRTSFDVISDILTIDRALTFEEKLNSIIEKSQISLSDQELLEQLVNAGNASAHRAWKPSSEELNTLMDVFEHFVENLFIRPMRQENLKDRLDVFKGSIPAKQKRTKTKSPDETK